ncbi:MAG: hypothetical protein KDL31_09730 [Kiritimatiellae bacterium]|nr:hypothetical protein [Kiritimatiellia bacterium]
MTLRLASYGMRGFVGVSMTPRVVMDYAAAFGSYLNGGRVLVARDTRDSSPMLHAATLASLAGCGCEVLDLGVCPTPVAQFAVGLYEAAGAIAISGGHHGMGWNAITLVGSDGALLEPEGGESVLDVFHAGDFLRRETPMLGSARETADYIAPYMKALGETVDTAAIRAANLTVLIDPLAGAGCAFLEEFASVLGFRLVAINAQPSGYLPREAEPRPRSAQHLASFIRHVKGDAGFVLNSDMSRMSLVTDEGEPISEELTLPLIANHVLARTPGIVVTNICTTRTLDEVAAHHGCDVSKSAVGQAYVVAGVKNELAVIGGEGSGSMVLPSFTKAFDGFLMMALVLEAMAKSAVSLGELLRRLPRFHIVKRRIPCEARRAYPVLDQLTRESDEWREGGEVSTLDGIRVDWGTGWLHVRASHTEQVIRVISEDQEKEKAQQRAEQMVRRITELL